MRRIQTFIQYEFYQVNPEGYTKASIENTLIISLEFHRCLKFPIILNVQGKLENTFNWIETYLPSLYYYPLVFQYRINWWRNTYFRWIYYNRNCPFLFLVTIISKPLDSTKHFSIVWICLHPGGLRTRSSSLVQKIIWKCCGISFERLCHGMKDNGRAFARKHCGNLLLQLKYLLRNVH